MQYLYFAKLSPDNEGKIEVTFPDLGVNAATFGDSVADAVHMAKDALAGYLLTAEDFQEKLPRASNYHDLEYNKENHELLVPIEVNTAIARDRENNRSVKKTLTIPKYLNDLGNKNKINFSATLTEALEQKLGV